MKDDQQSRVLTGAEWESSCKVSVVTSIVGVGIEKVGVEVSGGFVETIVERGNGW